MTSAQIETNADIGGLSSPDIDLPTLLRDKVVPKFLHDVGYVSWRRRKATISITTGVKVYALPADVEVVQMVTLAGVQPDLQYIGENPEKFHAAEAAATNAKPTGYYLDYDPAGVAAQNQLKLNCPADTNYSAIVSYYASAVFADYSTVVDMGKFVPLPYQWALVEGMKMEIFFVRFGIGDPRFLAAEKMYADYVNSAQENKERARRNMPVFVR